MARVNTFSGRGGVLHGGDGGAEPPRGPSRGLPQPEDAPPIFQEEEPDQGYQGSVSLEELLGRPETRNCPWIDPDMEDAYW